MPQIARVQYSATSQDTALAFMSSTYEHFSPHRPGQDARAVLEYRSASFEGMAADRIAYSMPGSAEAAPCQEISVITMLRGQVHYGPAERSPVRIAGRESFMLPADRPVEAAWTDHDIAMLRIDPRHVQRVAQERLGAGPAPVRFLSSTPLDNERSRFWHSSQLNVTRQLLEEPAMTHPLLQHAAVDYVCTAMLAAFPNSAGRQHATTGPGGVAPRSIRRAMAFIEEHAASPITMSDIAEAAGVTPRALQQGFARHVGSRPMEYLRRVRLERAHLDLRAADPSLGSTVASIAHRWGFARPERFAASYRAVYGVPPSQTLRSDG